MFYLQLLDLIRCFNGIEYFAKQKMEPIFQALLNKWPQILQIVKILEIPYITTKMIQNPNFALSDFYGCWLKMQIQIKNCIQPKNSEIGLAEAMLDSLNKRKKQLLKHPAMICAVFLDPR